MTDQTAGAAEYSYGGHRMLHRLDGVGDGKGAIVLVHGVGLGAASTGRLAAALVDPPRTARSVHRVELPGFGGTPAQPTLPLVRQHAEVLAAFLRDRVAGPVVLVGHSMGTAVAVQIAIDDPDLVDRLVLIGPVTDPGARSTPRQALRLLRDTMREPPSTNRTVLREYLQCGLRRYLATLPDMLAFDVEAAARQVRRPVLIVRGVDDPIAPRAWCESLVTHFPDARLLQVPRAAHVVLHSRPGAVAAAIERFLAVEAGS